MKRKISLFLAIVMLLGCFAGLTAAAEGETTAPAAYEPKIAYTNVAYTEGLVLMFAVNAPAELPEGAKVELLVWKGIEDVTAFSANDEYVETITESKTVTIGGASYLAFEYDKLSAQMMTNVVYARPLYTDADGKRTYGDVVDYSVVEYVKVANGEFEGFAGLAEEKKNVLNSLLNFGATAQIYLGEEGAAYTPNGYLANEELHKIWVTPKINGVLKEKVFAGFFKYEEGGEVTVSTPFYDGISVAGYKDAAGNVLEDLDIRSLGLQITAVDSDIELVAEYQHTTLRYLSAAELGPDFEVNNREIASHTIGASSKGNFSGVACTMDSYGRANYWHSLKTVADPEDPEQLVMQLSATNAPALMFNATKASDFTATGFGDTVYPAITYEFEIGSVDGKPINTGSYYFRHRTTAFGGKYCDLKLFDIKNNALKLADGTVACTIPSTGMTKIAIVLDTVTAEVRVYMENADGVMELACESTQKLPNATFNEVYGGLTGFFAKNSLEPTWVFGIGGKTIPEFESASIEVNGEMMNIKDGDTFNMSAVKALAERDCSFYLDEFKYYVGDLYK